MNTDQTRERFLELLRADREAGRLGSLASYRKLFDGSGEMIAEEYARFTAPVDPPSSATALLERLAQGDHPGYTREGEIARGGMGAIVKIRDEALRRDLAMKVILEERAGGDPELSSALHHRFLEEAQVTAQLDHPGVVPVHELGVDDDGRFFFTMKLVKGRTREVARRRTVEKERALRRARALGLSNASAAASRRPVLALLLAREAGRIQMLPEVVSQLHAAIQESRERACLKGHEGVVRSAVFSPAGDRILTGSWVGTARLWNSGGKELAVLRGHEEIVMSAAFSPSGDRILTASTDGTARLWSREGEELAVLRGHRGIVYSAVFSPSGDRILTASHDRTARLWFAHTADLMKLADERITRDFTPAERRRFAALLDS